MLNNINNLPRNLGGFGERLAAMHFQLAFHIPLNHCVIVVELDLPTTHHTASLTARPTSYIHL